MVQEKKAKPASKVEVTVTAPRKRTRSRKVALEEDEEEKDVQESRSKRARRVHQENITPIRDGDAIKGITARSSVKQVATRDDSEDGVVVVKKQGRPSKRSKPEPVVTDLETEPKHRGRQGTKTSTEPTHKSIRQSLRNSTIQGMEEGGERSSRAKESRGATSPDVAQRVQSTGIDSITLSINEGRGRTRKIQVDLTTVAKMSSRRIGFNYRQVS